MPAQRAPTRRQLCQKRVRGDAAPAARAPSRLRPDYRGIATRLVPQWCVTQVIQRTQAHAQRECARWRRSGAQTAVPNTVCQWQLCRNFGKPSPTSGHAQHGATTTKRQAASFLKMSGKPMVRACCVLARSSFLLGSSPLLVSSRALANRWAAAAAAPPRPLASPRPRAARAADARAEEVYGKARQP